MQPNIYRKTLSACCFSYISQAIVVNLPPLLFVLFTTQLNLPLTLISALIMASFFIQMLTDLIFSKYAVKLGYRICTIGAHTFCALGLIMLGLLPLIMSPFVGLLIAYAFMSVGGGLLEVLISPITDAIPTTNSSSGALMSLLHSFYSWGAVAVILFTTLFFATPLLDYWHFIPLIWAIIPLIGILLFCFVPFPPREENHKTPYKKLFCSGLFWCMVLLMITAGAAEQSIAQWASLFAEMGLNLSKTMGNLLGACAFAALMGVSRVLYGIFGKRFKIKTALIFSMLLTVVAYVLIVFVPSPVVNLIGCALCGLGVGVAWPGVLSLASKKIPSGGTAMFALLALGGDIGCAIGPGIVGLVSNLYNSSGSNWLFGLLGEGAVGGLKSGLMFAMLFPIIMVVILLFLRGKSKRKKGDPLYKTT